MYYPICNLPSLSQLSLESATSHRNPPSSKLDIANLLSSPPLSPTCDSNNLKIKRKRASPEQLSVLNHVFNQTFFPSTEVRRSLGKQLGMSPRTVQIWFQNKRQALRTRGHQTPQPQQQQSLYYLPPISPPTSPSFEIQSRSISLPPLRFSPQPDSFNIPSPASVDYFSR